MMCPPVPAGRNPEGVVGPLVCKTCGHWARDGFPFWRYCPKRKGRTWCWETCDEYQD